MEQRWETDVVADRDDRCAPSGVAALTTRVACQRARRLLVVLRRALRPIDQPACRRRTGESCRSAPPRARPAPRAASASARARPARGSEWCRRRARYGAVRRPRRGTRCAGPSPPRLHRRLALRVGGAEERKVFRQHDELCALLAAVSRQPPGLGRGSGARRACTSSASAATFIVAATSCARGPLTPGGSSAQSSPFSSCSADSRSTIGSAQLPVTQYDARPMPLERLLEDAREDQERRRDRRVRRATRRRSAARCRAPR